MAEWYTIEGRLKPVASTEALPKDVPVVAVVTPQEYANFGTTEYHSTIMALATVENTYLDIFPHCSIGSFAMPRKDSLLDDPSCFAFYMDREHLLFIDEGDTCRQLLETIAALQNIGESTTAYCLFEFMRLIIKGDQSYLAKVEDEMEQVEEKILGQQVSGANQLILNYRRKLLRLDTYYQQLNDMAVDLMENDNDQFTPEDLRCFAEIDRSTDRLTDRVHTLQEYSVQLRELYNTQLDSQQNSIMKVFTVITTLVTPLTLLAGWFGMNFTNIPGTNTPFGFAIFMATSAVVFIVELLFLRHKGWL